MKVIPHERVSERVVEQILPLPRTEEHVVAVFKVTPPGARVAFDTVSGLCSAKRTNINPCSGAQGLVLFGRQSRDGEVGVSCCNDKSA